ncbi:MAG: DUF4167 domain-containing protein [Stappiaceae bacterium]
MRQNNQNQNKQRMRGRGGRKGPNPLTRTYDSNGPDVKVRGTAHHVAEKYQQLARDSQASGDRIMAENYLQHAEHYLRIVAAAQPAPQQHQASRSGGESGEREREQQPSPANDSPIAVPVMAADAPQPVVDGIPDFNQKHGNNGSASSLPEQEREGTEQSNGPSDPTSASSDGEENRPRRRTRGSRGRGVRRPPQNEPIANPTPSVETSVASGESEAKVAEEVKPPAESPSQSATVEEVAPAPKRRRRPSKPAAEATPVENTAAESSDADNAETGSGDQNPTADHLAG